MKKDNFTDQEIVQGIQNQNSNVLLFVYHKNFKSVLHYIEQNSGSYTDAEDAMQEAMVLIYNKIRNNDLNLSCSLNTYLLSVIKHAWLNQLKHNGKFQVSDLTNENIIDDDADLNDSIKHTKRKIMYLKHFKELATDCQKVIGLFLKGLSIKEITKTMGYGSEQYTRNKRLKCKQILLEKIQLNPYFKELTNGTVR